MIFSTSTLLSIAVSLLSISNLVTAIPATPLAPRDPISPRGQYPNEMFYMVNCIGNGRTGSLFAYYQNGKGGSQHNELPDAYAIVSDGYLVTWEGQQYTRTFKWQGAGTQGTSRINGNGNSVGNYNYAGSASNSYGQQFNCYKDNGRVLFPCNAHPDFNGMGTTCNSVYYCFDVSDLFLTQ